MAQTKGILERVFKLSEKGTTVKTEILAGLTTASSGMPDRKQFNASCERRVSQL